jgi:hypothetical protein
MPNVNIPAPRVAFIDERTGLMAREWFLFLSTLGQASTDGDKGDITVSNIGTTFTINDGSVGTDQLGDDITAFIKTLLDDASAAAARSTLGIRAGNVPFVPNDDSDWPGGIGPDDVGQALDLLASRTDPSTSPFLVANGDTMTGNLTFDGGVLLETVQIVAATNGGSTQIGDYVRQVILTNASVIATYTLTFPANPVDKQRLGVSHGPGGVTALTLSPSSSETIRGTIAGMGADSFATWQYRASNTTWYLVG